MYICSFYINSDYKQKSKLYICVSPTSYSSRWSKIKRKVVQHGPSTLIISLPSKWIKQHSVKKGDELDVDVSGDNILIRCQKRETNERVEIDIAPFGKMIPRAIYALYKRGVNELKLNYDDKNTFALIQGSLGKESIGFEILEIGKNYCIIKNVSESTREFNQVLRQTFLLLLSMAEEGYNALRQGNLARLNELLLLEETNNRFTTFCRRYLNVYGSEKYDRIGPIYFIVEQLESIADNYKYFYKYFINLQSKKIEISTDLWNCFNDTNRMLRNFYNLFYKFSEQDMDNLKEQRDALIKSLYSALPQIKKPCDVVAFHNLLMMATDIFNLAGPYLVLEFRNHEDSAKQQQ